MSLGETCAQVVVESGIALRQRQRRRRSTALRTTLGGVHLHAVGSGSGDADWVCVSCHVVVSAVAAEVVVELSLGRPASKSLLKAGLRSANSNDEGVAQLRAKLGGTACVEVESGSKDGAGVAAWAKSRGRCCFCC